MLPNCANSITCAKDLSVKIENNSVGVFEGHTVIPPKIDLVKDAVQPKILGENDPENPKHIYVDLTSQTLYAYKGKDLVFKTFISSGKWASTPTGDFKIWIKLRSTRMSGGEGDDFYDLPNVPYTMFFYNDEVPKYKGYSLHGAYWHNNFGYPMSHGCVNMRTIDAKVIYDFVDPPTKGKITNATIENPGTIVTIYGETPDYKNE